jgi:hypothetical protein
MQLRFNDVNRLRTKSIRSGLETGHTLFNPLEKFKKAIQQLYARNPYYFQELVMVSENAWINHLFSIR